jgi:hypothetical protein
MQSEYYDNQHRNNIESFNGYGKETSIVMIDASIKNIKDIKVGDEIMTHDGFFGKVKKLFQGREQMYKINPVPELNSITNISPYVVSENHIMVLVKNLPNIAKTNPNLKTIIQNSIFKRKHGYQIDDIDTMESPVSSLSLDKIYYGVCSDWRDNFLYCFTIEKLEIDDYYGFELDGKARFLNRESYSS